MIDLRAIQMLIEAFNGQGQYGPDYLMRMLQMGQEDAAKTAKPAPAPSWATTNPANATDLARQLSANAGQMLMPGGPIGALQIPAHGSSQQPRQGFNPATYGMDPNYGEATFYGQAIRGGMAPINAVTPLGVPQGWNPFGTTETKKKD